MKTTFVLFSSVIATLIVLSPLARGQGRIDGSQSPNQSDGISFEKKKIKIGTKIITAEIADTNARREHGLMFRERLLNDAGMLFIFPYPQRVSFWMKNTLIPLSIGYFGEDQVLREIHEMTPAVMGEKMPRTYPSEVDILYALEMPKEWFKHNGIKPGARFSFVGAKK
jgi:uncharacterized membrane protein (UPF0127 family)